MKICVLETEYIAAEQAAKALKISASDLAKIGLRLQPAPDGLFAKIHEEVGKTAGVTCHRNRVRGLGTKLSAEERKQAEANLGPDETLADLARKTLGFAAVSSFARKAGLARRSKRYARVLSTDEITEYERLLRDDLALRAYAHRMKGDQQK
jgi:hypothetical protein